MQFVMVPVPEEHAPEVLRYVDRLRSRTLRDPWDTDGVAALVASSDEPTQAFLTILADAMIEHRELLHSTTARQLDLSERELSLLMFAITMRTNELRRHNLFGTQPLADAQSGEGAAQGEEKGEVTDRRITMPDDLARMVVRAASDSEAVGTTDRATGARVEAAP